MELSNKLTKYQPIPNLSIANFDPIAADDYKAQSIEPYEGILPEDVLLNERTVKWFMYS